jgi:hypothetical protein
VKKQMVIPSSECGNRSGKMVMLAGKGGRNSLRNVNEIYKYFDIYN